MLLNTNDNGVCTYSTYRIIFFFRIIAIESMFAYQHGFNNFQLMTTCDKTPSNEKAIIEFLSILNNFQTS